MNMSLKFKGKRTSGYGSKKTKRDTGNERLPVCAQQFFDSVDAMFASRHVEKLLDALVLKRS